MREVASANPTAADVLRLAFDSQKAQAIAERALLVGGEFTQQALGRAARHERWARRFVGVAVPGGAGALAVEIGLEQHFAAGLFAVAAIGMAAISLTYRLRSTKAILVADGDSEVDGISYPPDTSPDL